MVIKKKNIANLIKYHAEHDDEAFRKEAFQVIHAMGEDDIETSNYLVALLSNHNTFTPQDYELDPEYFHMLPEAKDSLYLPEPIKNDILNIANIFSRAKRIGINKILFKGAPGTGKTEAARQLARITRRDLYVADFSRVIDSKLGQTAKNIVALFRELNTISNPTHFLILFDEIDAIALNRIDKQDIREMGRATTEILKGLDSLSGDISIIATTNLFKELDQALRRRFDLIVDFDRYTDEDNVEVACNILLDTLKQFEIEPVYKDIAKKIFTVEPKTSPGEMKNSIRASVVFSDPNSDSDYLARLIERLSEGKHKATPEYLVSNNFTLREVEIITGISKSTLSRRLKDSSGVMHE